MVYNQSNMAKSPTLTKPKLIKALNRWMEHYTEHPEEFDHEFQTVNLFLEEKKAGKVPSYGQIAYAMLIGYLKEKPTSKPHFRLFQEPKRCVSRTL